MDYLAAEFPQISSLMYIINTKRNDSLADRFLSFSKVKIIS